MDESIDCDYGNVYHRIIQEQEHIIKELHKELKIPIRVANNHNRWLICVIVGLCVELGVGIGALFYVLMY